MRQIKKMPSTGTIETKHMQNAATGTVIAPKTGTSFLPFCGVHCDAVGDRKERLSDTHCKAHLYKILQRLSYC